MRGLKFMFNSWKRMPKALTIFVGLMSLAAEVLPFVFHEQLGEEDYMFPKVFLFFGMVVFVCLFAIASGGEMSMNKFVRSTPIAKELYTRSVPLFIAGVAGVQTVIMGGYFVFLGIKGAELAQFSDTLILGAIVCGSMMLFMPVTFTITMGGLLGLYATIIPIVVTMLALEKGIKLNGFGAPLPLAIGIYAGTLVLGTVWAFGICRSRFKKSKVVIYNSVAAASGK